MNGAEQTLRPEDLAVLIDHTLLKPDATDAAIETLCKEAVQYRFYSVCVNGGWVKTCRDLLRGTGVRISAVCGFPLGAAAGVVKAFEAERAVLDGAAEIDMVLSVGHLLAGRYDQVQSEIRDVVSAAGGAVVKVILETGLLTDEQKRIACRLAEQAGAHFVKTSTGFGPGGATAHDVRLLRQSVSPAMGVKASGGIRDYVAAATMVAAGANRIGTSSGVAIMRGAAGSGPY